MNILVVDDEPKLRRGISNYLSQMNLNFNCIETAENGEIALIKARELKPEIIFLDICMPKMNGLEFIESLSLESEQPEIIIISGFDDFSYVQKALRYHVSEYLLKPINLDEFDNLVHRTYNKILLKQKQTTYTNYAHHTIVENKDHLQDLFFCKILKGQLSDIEITKEAFLLRIIFPYTPNMILIKIPESFEEGGFSLNIEAIRFAIRNILYELCQDLFHVSIFFDWNNNVIILSDFHENIALYCDKIEQTLHNVVGYKPNIMSNQMDDFDYSTTYKKMFDQKIIFSTLSDSVKKAKVYIDTNFQDPSISLDIVSEKIGIGPSYLSKLMSEQLNKGFVDYLTEVRMKQSTQILKNSSRDMMIYEIASNVGYSSQHYFCRVFKKYYGLSPVQYKDKYYEK